MNQRASTSTSPRPSPPVTFTPTPTPTPTTPLLRAVRNGGLGVRVLQSAPPSPRCGSLFSYPRRRSPDQPSGMHSEKRKRLKVHNEGTSYNSGYKNGEEVIDYSDGFALNKFLSGLETGKYGSVTKEFEAVHAQRMEVMNMISKYQSSYGSPSASQGVKSFQASFARSNGFNHQSKVNLKQHCDIIDLDIDTCVVTRGNHIPEKETRKDEVPVINLDSDDEDGYPQAGVNSTCTLKNPHAPASFESLLKIQANLSDESISNQLVLYPQGFTSLNFDTPVVGERPSVQYEKVVLRVNEKPSSIQYQKVVLNNGTEQEQTPLPLQKEPAPLPLQKELISLEKEVLKTETKKPLVPLEKKAPKKDTKKPRVKRQKSSVGRDEKASEDLHGGVNGNTESALTSLVGMQDLSMEMQESPPRVESYNDDDGAVTPEISGLDDLWQEMSLAMECSKDAMESDESSVIQNEEECDHSFVLQEDFGLVCRVCGVIQKSIDTIFDFQWKKAPRMIAYKSGSHRSKDVVDDVTYSGPKFSEQNLLDADISVHPRHLKQMRPHQIEGFNFLVKNMVTDDPGGCILAHAPGSGKTFLLISFIQSFLAKLPHARILVIVPKGILATWKTEFRRWQVEDIPIYDFYSSKANNRAQQLAILNSWQETRSILLLGYKQFSNIVTDGDELSLRCREKLLDVPSLLIMDEGHTPRNQETDVLQSLEKVKTPCKVVLSGTLFQNRVKEVFNIFNLVRPKFLMRSPSIDVVRRIMSRIKISGRKGCAENSFYDLVEETLQNDDNYLRKVSIIKDLRELTQDVLHYYKGDILDELPGLVDFTVHLNLTPKQKEILKDMEKYQKFKRSAMENAVFIHPLLTEIRDHATADKDSNVTDEKIENILNEMDARDGVKTKFFLKILSMAESAGEKVLVFSRYLVPLKFLEKLVINTNGWRRGTEVFMILGDSNAEQREIAMEQFNNSPDAKVFFGSIKACGEGISLVGASRVLILDIHLNPSVTRQAIGRAFRPGQKKKVYTYRLVAADSLEEEDHNTSFKKELMSKMWFDWSEYCSQRSFELEKVDVADSQDTFLEASNLGQDIKALYRR